MTVKLEDRQALIVLARYYWIEEKYNILEAIIKAEKDLEG